LEKNQEEKDHDFGSFGKNHEEEDHNFEVSAKNKKTIAMGFSKKLGRKKPQLWELWKTMKKKTKPMGVLEKTRIVIRRSNPCFLESYFFTQEL
jgi:hypothetical protein